MNDTLPVVSVNASKCIHCERCIDDCLAKILVFSADNLLEFVPGGAERCFRCQHCMAICPVGALSWSGKTPDKSNSMGLIPEPEQMINLLRQRRSIRSYRRGNVDHAILDKIQLVMDFVPTGCNDHRLFFSWSDDIFLTDTFRRDAANSVLKMIASQSLPTSIAHFSSIGSALAAGSDIFFRNAPHFVAIATPPDSKDAHIDPYIAATHIELLANCFHLGTCWGGMITDLFLADPNLYKRLNIPVDHELKIVMLLGIPSVKYARTTQPTPCRRTRVSGN